MVLILLAVAFLGIILISFLGIALFGVLFKTLIGISFFGFIYNILVVLAFLSISTIVAFSFFQSKKSKPLILPTVALGTIFGFLFAFRGTFKETALGLAYGDVLSQGVIPSFTVSNNMLVAVGGMFFVLVGVVVFIMFGVSKGRPSPSGGGGGRVVIGSFIALILLVGMVFAVPSLFSEKGCFDGTKDCPRKVSVFRVDFPFEACNPLLSRSVDLSIGSPIAVKQEIFNPTASEIEDITLFIKASDPGYDSGFVTQNIGDLGNIPNINNCESGKISVTVFGGFDGVSRNYNYVAFTENVKGEKSNTVTGNFAVRG